MIRYALVSQRSSSRETIERYLPGNYAVVATVPYDGDDRMLPGLYAVVEGEDACGWTMEDYVIPRLASGLIVSREVKAHHPLVRIAPLVARYEALCDDPHEAYEEAAREYRLTTGDCYAFRTEEDLAYMREAEADQIRLARQTAGVCDEFPAGEFAVPGFNCEFDPYD